MQVLFGLRPALRQRVPENTVLIVPSADDWNDFGLRTRIDYLIRIQEADPVATSGHIGFLDKEGVSRGSEQLVKIVEESGKQMVSAGSKHRFFTMLPDMEAYRILVRDFGVEDASTALGGTNDLVALNEFSPRSELLESATRSDVFTSSFMRSSETFFAFKNAGSILRGLSEEQVGVLSRSLAIRFRMAGRENDHDLAFHFDHDGALPKRIAVVIGKNGVGKSQTLGRIARAALNGSGDLTDGTENGRPLINRLLAFAPTNEAESVFPSEKRKRPRIWYQRYSLNRSRRARRNDYVSDLVVQLARSPETIGEVSRWRIFLKAVGALSEPGQIHLVTTASSTSSPTFISLTEVAKGSEQRKLERFASIDLKKEPLRLVENKGYPLSSGEISFLKFAAQASLTIENGSLLLLDEPETHLHPNFISRFVSLLNRLLELTGSAAIIATHSVYFVKEVFREQVSVLRIDDEGAVQVDRPLLRTFGADVGAISYFVFGEDEPSGLAEEVGKRLLAMHGSWEEIYQQYKDELSLEFLNSLRSASEQGGAV
ncbi:AAA family ATPase [Pseudoxanthomonas suwonensis]|uniref:AAA+ ATPase domain-containing protein n=1 Tax=Pseudoxanthomonas suwonensis TaxID=314722 RepID=A0A0E3UMG3_9GAMM|nr:AAA family ATPase [Pseudoxanthomonas suwonensis]AKC86306.1 hypothetical protein WQ53_05475 [Pseudoxanthomonas suwonensis]